MTNCRSTALYEKPAIPYTEGRRFVVRRHIPPLPLGRPYPNNRTMTPEETLEKQTQLEYCLAAPLGGTDGQDFLSFTITKELAVRDGRGAQVVAVNHRPRDPPGSQEGQPNDKPTNQPTNLAVNHHFVAKIYDPLYYPAYYEDTSVKNDVVYLAERDYSREAAAYEELNTQFGGTIIPRYYGSWTCECERRPVRLVLMELVDGVSMLSLDPAALSKEQRSNIMVKAIQAEYDLYRHGVYHGDFYPRNVVVCNLESAAALRVVLIDFNTAIVHRLTQLPREIPGHPISPIARYESELDDEFSGWVPSPLDEWLREHFGDLNTKLQLSAEPEAVREKGE